ncbi:MAG TPA: NAD(P)/FAD-dependent oxidoreductase [Candidatus Limnocylindrales bacterium]|nr:NAD(P)/FAD-dependent oxidoreductase [Candidatus Limnocylindrales bacterium]
MTTPLPERADVVIVGAGPAGSALAARLARHSIDTLVLEQTPMWRWHAGGVFASPVAVAALADTGLDAAAIARLTRRIPAMRLETPAGVTVRLTYGADTGGQPAVGFDRSTLDPALEGLATAAGATVRRGATVTGVDLGERHAPVVHVRTDDGSAMIRSRVVVGADGAGSIVARAAGVARPSRLAARVGLTYHTVDDRSPDEPADARLVVFRDGYVGIAPVPRGRVNVGIVLGPTWRARLARDGAVATAEAVQAAIPVAPDDPSRVAFASRTDRVVGAWPIGGRTTQCAGPDWLLVGDAVGFLDPFTGEGIHRALVSAGLAAAAIVAELRGGGRRHRALRAYERGMRRRFATKDVVSWLVQAFLARPWLFEYAARRLADRPEVRATMGLVIGDLLPARRGLDPRFLAALLAP